MDNDVRSPRYAVAFRRNLPYFLGWLQINRKFVAIVARREGGWYWVILPPKKSGILDWSMGKVSNGKK
jgi:hypothetical protein